MIVAAVSLAFFPLQDLPRGVVPPREPALERMRARVAELVERGEAPSISVAVGRGGEVLWQESFGWANREAEIAATPHTPYPVASMTKSMTATAVMALVEDGQLSLSSSVPATLGEGALRVHEGTPDDLTVLRLLTYRGGIPHGWEVYPLESAAGLAIPSSAKSVLRHALVTFPPDDESFLYSNYAYGIAERLIEVVSEQSYAEFLAQRLFGPLGMQDSAARITPELAARAAVEYPGEQAGPASVFLPGGGAGAFASAHDVLRYGLFHL